MTNIIYLDKIKIPTKGPSESTDLEGHFEKYGRWTDLGSPESEGSVLTTAKVTIAGNNLQGKYVKVQHRESGERFWVDVLAHDVKTGGIYGLVANKLVDTALNRWHPVCFHIFHVWVAEDRPEHRGKIMLEVKPINEEKTKLVPSDHPPHEEYVGEEITDTGEENKDPALLRQEYIVYLHEHNHGPFKPPKDQQHYIELTTLRIADGLEFEVDKDIAPFIEACWKSGIFVVQSEAWSDSFTVRLQIASPDFANQFLANLFADGDIYWESDRQVPMLGNWHEVDAYTKIIPGDWEWSLSFDGEIDESTAGLLEAAATYLGKTTDEMERDMYWASVERLEPEPSVIVRFPQEYLELLTERLVSKETDRPEPDGLLWMLLPEMEEDEDEEEDD